MILSLSLTTWLHLGRGVTRVVLGSYLGPEIPGPGVELARAARIPIDGPPSPCEQCERILPYGELWRSMTEPSRAYCEECMPEAIMRQVTT